MQPIFFANQLELRQWFKSYHKTETELLVGFYKVGTGKPSITWPQSVDEALCFGWIDGIRKSIDNDCYCIRFTPRKANSNWSTVNIKKVEELIQKKLMQPAGLAIYEKRIEAKSGVYSYEGKPSLLDEKFENEFRKNKKAWQYFQSMPALSYQKVAIRWVMSAKQEPTRIKRLHGINQLLRSRRKDKATELKHKKIDIFLNTQNNFTSGMPRFALLMGFSHIF